MDSESITRIGMIIGAVVILFFIVWLFSVECESWVNYQQYPFGDIKTGAGEYVCDRLTPRSSRFNVGFYVYPLYRNPYNYPVKFYQDYPRPHYGTGLMA